jgi:hypothetical protein
MIWWQSDWGPLVLGNTGGRWRYDEYGHVERQEYWGEADPYVVPFGGDF